jgi:hypothetical protein
MRVTAARTRARILPRAAEPRHVHSRGDVDMSTYTLLAGIGFLVLDLAGPLTESGRK